jgi:nicotinamidase/pyrazinamidase
MKALLLVDIQNDFLPGGALGVKNADQIIPVIQKLLDRKKFDLIVATKDWHPQDHVSFWINHPGKNPGDIVMVQQNPQILWPAHCVQNTQGAEFAPGWDTSKINRTFYKGTHTFVDSYSAF